MRYISFRLIFFVTAVSMLFSPPILLLGRTAKKAVSPSRLLDDIDTEETTVGFEWHNAKGVIEMTVLLLPEKDHAQQDNDRKKYAFLSQTALKDWIKQSKEEQFLNGSSSAKNNVLKVFFMDRKGQPVTFVLDQTKGFSLLINLTTSAGMNPVLDAGGNNLAYKKITDFLLPKLLPDVQ